MLDEGIREKVEVSPVGLQARPGALVRLVEEISHLRRHGFCLAAMSTRKAGDTMRAGAYVVLKITNE